jgi:hypothetical protein
MPLPQRSSLGGEPYRSHTPVVGSGPTHEKTALFESLQRRRQIRGVATKSFGERTH